MTDIKNIREGQKVTVIVTGVAKNVDYEGVGFDVDPGPGYDYIYVDSGLVELGAVIEVEKDPFPTEPGVYVPRNNADQAHHSYLYINQTGSGWKEYNGKSVVPDAEASARDTHGRLGGLVRLGPVE